MKLSGHEKSLADAGQESHAVDAVVNRTGCDVRFARHHVTRYLEKRADGIAVEIESVTDRFAEIGEYAKLRRAIRDLCARAARDGFAGYKPVRRLESVCWLIKDPDGFYYAGLDHDWTKDRDASLRHDRYSDALRAVREWRSGIRFDSRVVRLTTWKRVKK